MLLGMFVKGVAKHLYLVVQYILWLESHHGVEQLGSMQVYLHHGIAVLLLAGTFFGTAHLVFLGVQLFLGRLHGLTQFFGINKHCTCRTVVLYDVVRQSRGIEEHGGLEGMELVKLCAIYAQINAVRRFGHKCLVALKSQGLYGHSLPLF